MMLCFLDKQGVCSYIQLWLAATFLITVWCLLQLMLSHYFDVNGGELAYIGLGENWGI
jgi:hypothetical protein